MAKRYERLEIRTLGRRLFLKVGGAVALSTLLPACAEPEKVTSPLDPATDAAQGDTSTDPTLDAAPASDVQEVSTVDTAHTSGPPDPCEGLDPDPLGGGADAEIEPRPRRDRVGVDRGARRRAHRIAPGFSRRSCKAPLRCP